MLQLYQRLMHRILIDTQHSRNMWILMRRAYANRKDVFMIMLTPTAHLVMYITTMLICILHYPRWQDKSSFYIATPPLDITEFPSQNGSRTQNTHHPHNSSRKSPSRPRSSTMGTRATSTPRSRRRGSRTSPSRARGSHSGHRGGRATPRSPTTRWGTGGACSRPRHCR